LPQTLVHIAAQQNKWDNKLGNSPLSLFVRSVHPLVSNATIKYIDEHCFYYTVRKGAHLLKAGDTSEYLYLIIKGAFRGYIKQGSKDLTTWIDLENEVMTSIRSLYLHQPSLENIQALEDAELIGASIKDLEYLYEHFPDMNVVGRKLLEKYYIDAEERAYIGRITSATTKYNHLVTTRPDIANRILLRYIASYLGITLETLSRIRSKLAQ
jgi:CRP-like cAMP-binding protein